MAATAQAEKDIIFHEALHAASMHGWSSDIFKMAAERANIDKAYAELIFIGGVDEILDMYFIHIDKLMMDEVLTHDIASMRVGERIKLALKSRIKVMEPYKKLTSKTVSHLLLPWNVPTALRLGWRTMDTIWYDVGNDQSTDFNYYTKRGILYTVYISVIKYWLADHSNHNYETMEFIDRQIDRVLGMGKKFKKK